MSLRIHRLAVAEIDHEVDYYESRHAGLGTELEDEIDAAFSLILRFPKAAPQWRDRPDRRVAVLDHFPFTIPYQILREHALTSTSNWSALRLAITRLMIAWSLSARRTLISQRRW